MLLIDVLHKTMFNNSMSLYFNFGSKHVFVNLWKNSLWTWLHIYERGSPSSLLASNTVFLVYYPNAEYIFMSTIKAAHKQYILQVEEYDINKQLSKFIIYYNQTLEAFNSSTFPSDSLSSTVFPHSCYSGNSIIRTHWDLSK